SLWVTGSNSLLQASSLVRAGQFGGFSLLVITNGGTVNGNTGSVGGNSSSTNNTVILTGPGSGWHSASTLTLGSTGGKNSIRVANGAQLVNTRGIIGNGSSNNLVVVTGAGTLWSNATDLWVGGQIMSPHDNLLLVSDNATVLTTNLLISQSASAMSNYVTVAGGNLFVTNSSQYGTLDIRRGT